MTTAPAPANRPTYSDADKAYARRCFEHARKAFEAKNYDYAIELFIQGLERWPEAVDEGLKMLRAVGVARRGSGGKPPGFFESRKFPTNGKDARVNLLHALRLLALEPTNAAHMEAILTNAAKAAVPDVVHWIGPVLWESIQHEKKIPESRFQSIYRCIDCAGELFQQSEEFGKAGDIYRVSQLVADFWREGHPNSADASKAVSDASSKLTIVKGRFGTNEDFRASLKDGAAQRDLQDQGRVVQPEDRLKELIDRARKDYQAEPESANRLTLLCDLLTRIENDAGEREAIGLLDATAKRTNNYAFKIRADDIRMKQWRRLARDAMARHQAQPADAALTAAAETARRTQIEGELAIFRDRAEHYPSDMRIRYEVGLRLFEAHRFDEAIPVFQQAQSDPRRRNHARLYIGRCFLEKRFHSQAVDVLAQALRDHETGEDDLGKALMYWLGRAQEASGAVAEASRLYGKLIQIDYNFRDARQRFEQLSAAGPQGPGTAPAST